MSDVLDTAKRKAAMLRNWARGNYCGADKDPSDSVLVSNMHLTWIAEAIEKLVEEHERVLEESVSAEAYDDTLLELFGEMNSMDEVRDNFYVRPHSDFCMGMEIEDARWVVESVDGAEYGFGGTLEEAAKKFIEDVRMRRNDAKPDFSAMTADELREWLDERGDEASSRELAAWLVGDA